jgi:hypothetical protein
MPEIPKPYRINYTFGDTINEMVSQAKADKLARDLQNQKLQQEMIMETQRQQMQIKRDELLHSQKQELTQEQRAENQIDREWNAKLTGTMAKFKADVDKSMQSSAQKHEMQMFMDGKEWESEKLDRKFAQDYSLMFAGVDADVQRAQKLLDTQITLIESEYGIKFDKEKLMLTDPEIQDAKIRNRMIDEKFTQRMIDYTKEKDKEMVLWAEENTIEGKQAQAKYDLFNQTVQQTISDNAVRKEMIGQIGDWGSQLIHYGFNQDPHTVQYGNWDSKNTKAVYKMLTDQMPYILSMAQHDPMGSKNPDLWNHLRGNLIWLDQTLSGLGWSDSMSWIRSVFGSQSGMKTQTINKYMETIKNILATKQQMVQQ